MTRSSDLDRFRSVRVLWPDHLGLARGKYVPARLAHRGTGFCVTTFGTGYDRDLTPAPGAHLFEGLKDVFATVDLDSLRPSWENDNIAVAVADLSIHGAPFETSSRATLRSSLAKWADLGYGVKVGLELEGYLLQPGTDGGWSRCANPRSFVYGTGLLADRSGFVHAVMEAADAAQFRLESVNAEFDESQFEFTLEYDDALTAVDDVFVFRVLVREVAIAMGLDFTFLGKPFPAVSGSGVHTNFSLVGADGSPALADGSEPDGLAALGRSCIAGLIEHHCALTAVSAPTVNAYRRLQPGTLAGCWANWGVDHRNVTNRVPAEGGASMRIESRLGDGAMNVHLGVAAVLEAARLGVVDDLAHVEPFTGVGFEEGGTEVRSALSLSEALDHLEADTRFVEALGADVVANFVANKRVEVEKFEATGDTLDSDEIGGFETSMYLPYH